MPGLQNENEFESQLHHRNSKNKANNFIEWSGGRQSEESHSLGHEALPSSGGTLADTSVYFARWQQGEQTVPGLCVVF